MAFDFDEDNNSDSSRSDGKKGKWEKAVQFVNFHIPMKDEDGEEFKIKLCAAGLKKSNKDHVKLVKFFEKGGAEAIERFQKGLIITVNNASNGESRGEFNF